MNGMYGNPYGGGSTATDAAVVGAQTVTGFASGLATGAAVAATVPVVGWIVGGVMGAAAGTVALIAAVKNGKIRQADAIKAAHKLGYPHPEKVPAFIVRALKLTKSKQRDLLSKYKAHYGKLKSRESHAVFPKLYKADMQKLKAKIDILDAMVHPKPIPQKGFHAALAKAPVVAANEAPNDAGVSLDPSADMDKSTANVLPGTEIPVIPAIIGTVVVVGLVAYFARKQPATGKVAK